MYYVFGDVISDWIDGMRSLDPLLLLESMAGASALSGWGREQMHYREGEACLTWPKDI